MEVAALARRFAGQALCTRMASSYVRIADDVEPQRLQQRYYGRLAATEAVRVQGCSVLKSVRGAHSMDGTCAVAPSR